MRKKRLLLFVLLIVAFPTYTYDWMDVNKIYKYFRDYFIVLDNELYFIRPNNFFMDSESLGLILGDDGFYELSIEDEQKYLIPGESFFSVLDKDYYKSYEYKESYDENYPYEYDSDELHYIVDLGIDEINATSFLTESFSSKTVIYRPENLLNKFYATNKYERKYNPRIPPWVEGVEGFGIGEKLNIKFGSWHKYLIVLNGYVDPYKSYLYKQNGRMKEIRITSKDSDFILDYTFEDYIYYADIIFPSYVSEIEIEIISVYEGSKYTDTCISGLLTTGDNVIDRRDPSGKRIWEMVRNKEY